MGRRSTPCNESGRILHRGDAECAENRRGKVSKASALRTITFKNIVSFLRGGTRGKALNVSRRRFKWIGICFLLPVIVLAQVRVTVAPIGGDDVPVVKQRIAKTLEAVLLEMNRAQADSSSLEKVKLLFAPEAYTTFVSFVTQNKAVTARKAYEPQMIDRMHGQFYDIRSIMVKIDPGETESSAVQNLIFTFSRAGLITSVRSMLPKYDFQMIVARGETAQDSLMRGTILDFMEQFRMAYNTKDTTFLEKVYSDDALIFVGTVLEEKRGADDMMRRSLLSQPKVTLIQQSKREYMDGLKRRAFAKNAFINVRFDEFSIVRHEKLPWLYGISCQQRWNSSTYSDKGYLFLMMDFRSLNEPVIHVRTWQPKAFEDGHYVGLDDFEIVGPQ